MSVSQVSLIPSVVLHRGAPVAGYLLDAYGGPSAGIQAYRPAMYYAGSVSLASAVLVATVAVLVRTGGNRQS